MEGQSQTARPLGFVAWLPSTVGEVIHRASLDRMGIGSVTGSAVGGREETQGLEPIGQVIEALKGNWLSCWSVRRSSTAFSIRPTTLRGRQSHDLWSGPGPSLE